MPSLPLLFQGKIWNCCTARKVSILNSSENLSRPSKRNVFFFFGKIPADICRRAGVVIVENADLLSDRVCSLEKCGGCNIHYVTGLKFTILLHLSPHRLLSILPILEVCRTRIIYEPCKWLSWTRFAFRLEVRLFLRLALAT